jgi:O-succinylbenzoic acid--CoA ligase
MNMSVSVDAALKALAAALNEEGPAVEFRPDGTTAPHLLEGIAAVVSTSGSTGTPKQTLLSAEALAASSMSTALRLQGEGQWLLALPVHFVAGLAVLSRSLYAGTRPWSMDLSRSFTAAGFNEAAAALTDRTRYTALVPTQLQRLLTNPTAETVSALRRFNAILLGGGPAPAPLLAEARRQGLKIHLTYGMSETCGGCVYDGVPLEGVQVRTEEGRIWVGGDVVASGYLGQPELSRSRFREEDGVRWFRTDDLGGVDEEGLLTVNGRADDVVITGGKKVSAAAVQRVIESLPGVEAALVAGVEDEQWGARLAAAVVGTVEAEAVQAAVRAAHGAHAAPKAVLLLEALPLLPNGKPDRRTVVRLLSGNAE